MLDVIGLRFDFDSNEIIYRIFTGPVSFKKFRKIFVLNCILIILNPYLSEGNIFIYLNNISGEIVHTALKMGDSEKRTVHSLQKNWNHHIDIDCPGEC